LYLNYWIDPTPSLLALPTIKAVWSWMQLKSTLEFIEQKSSSLNFEVATHLDNQLPVVKTLALLDRAILETSSRFNNLTLVMNALPDPVFAIDKAGQIVFANWAFDIFFSDGQAIKPLTIKDLISRFNFPPDSFNHSSSTSSTVRAVRLTADGVIKHFIPRSVMISWSGSERLHLYTCVDVTAVMTLQAQRDKTLQLLSHDMRSPLAGILLVCEQITSFDPLDTARITKFAQRALAMMDSFILAIKADSEQYEYADHVFDSILEQALYETRARAHKYNVSWVLKQDQLLYVNCDSRLIERVLVNIFNNAIRHSPPGGCVDIHIIKQDREHGPFLICTVKNFISTDDAGIAVDLHHKSYKLGYEFIEQVVRRHCGTVTKNFDTEHQQAVVEMALPCLAS
jgi:signal transduction histidine kinase